MKKEVKNANLWKLKKQMQNNNYFLFLLKMYFKLVLEAAMITLNKYVFNSMIF